MEVIFTVLTDSDEKRNKSAADQLSHFQFNNDSEVHTWLPPSSLHEHKHYSNIIYNSSSWKPQFQFIHLESFVSVSYILYWSNNSLDLRTQQSKDERGECILDDQVKSKM